MTDNLHRRIELAERSIRLNCSLFMQIRTCELVVEQALSDDNVEVWECWQAKLDELFKRFHGR